VRRCTVVVATRKGDGGAMLEEGDGGIGLVMGRKAWWARIA
jgi:hypothetical protein